MGGQPVFRDGHALVALPIAVQLSKKFIVFHFFQGVFIPLRSGNRALVREDTDEDRVTDFLFFAEKLDGIFSLEFPGFRLFRPNVINVFRIIFRIQI